MILHCLAQEPRGERLAIYLEDARYVGGITVHSIDKARHSFSYGIAIATPFRHQGLGKEALRLLLARYAARGYRSCTVQILASNTASLALHAALGFAQMARTNDGGQDILHLHRTLDNNPPCL